MNKTAFRHHHQQNAQFSECNNFLNELRETFQDETEAVLDPRKEALVSLSLEQPIREQEIQGYGFPVSFEKEKFLQGHGFGGGVQPAAFPDSFERSSLKYQKDSPKKIS